MKRKPILTLTALLVLGAMTISASPASAAEMLWQDAAHTKKQEVGANFTLQNEGEPELNAGGGLLVIKCKTSFVGGTLATNEVAKTSVSVQSLSFSQCKDAAANETEVQTKTAVPWTLEWEAAETFKLSGIKALIKDPAAGLPSCEVQNAAAAFKFKSLRAPAAVLLTAAAQPLKLVAATCGGIAAAAETAKYKVVAAPGAANNVFLF
jgi:hypothetical protein